MKYIYFLLKSRQYNWHLTLVYLFLTLSLCTNMFLAYTALSQKQTTIFVPTHIGEEFTFNGTFTPDYFERMAVFMSQRWLSFYNNQPLEPLMRFLCPKNKETLMKKRALFMSPYTRKGVQGFFEPKETRFIPPDTVKVLGNLSLFLAKEYLHHIPLSCTITFRIEHGQCFFSACYVRHEKPQAEHIAHT